MIAIGTMLRMSLTQLIAVYMDPKTCERIFPSKWDIIRPGAGLWQAKYTQKGIENIMDSVLHWIAPGEGDLQPGKPELEFVEAATTFNDCFKARIKGGLHPAEENRIKWTLRRAKEHPDVATPEEWVEKHLVPCIAKASKFLDLAKKKRFKTEEKECLSRLALEEKDSVSYDLKYFATRFLVTSRCVNNGAAVIFDSHEPIKKKEDVMSARGALRLSEDVTLDVKKMKVKDIMLATSAAPYFFKAHEVAHKGANFCFHDGGVMANDPGLINSCISYRHFTPKVSPRQESGIRYLPVFKLLRVGCGKEEQHEDSPIGPMTLQGATLVTQIPDIFMSADTHRTNLLASVSVQCVNTSALSTTTVCMNNAPIC